MRLRTCLLLVFALALLAAACGGGGGGAGQLKQAGILTIGSDVPYPPFEDFDQSGNVIGFDADLMNEIANRLGLEPVWVDTDFDTIFTQLAQGNFDVVASSVTVLPEREEQVDFAIPYYNTNQALTVNANLTPDIKSTADLAAGDAVAVQTGTTGAIWAKANLEPNGIIVREFTLPPDCFTELESGGVKGTIIDVDPSLDAEATRPGLAVVEIIDTNEVLAFAVNPENRVLLAAINWVLTAMIEDGTYQEMYDRWITRPDASILYEE